MSVSDWAQSHGQLASPGHDCPALWLSYRNVCAPPQVAASPAVSAGSAVGAAGFSGAGGLHPPATPTLQHGGRGAQHRRARDAPPALSTVPEVLNFAGVQKKPFSSRLQSSADLALAPAEAPPPWCQLHTSVLMYILAANRCGRKRHVSVRPPILVAAAAASLWRRLCSSATSAAAAAVQVPSASNMALALSPSEARWPGGESPLELRMMRPLGTALRAAPGLLAPGATT
jgi:hypothetical protein